MKLTAILLFAVCMQASAGGYAQKVTINENKASLQKIFRKIKNQTGYSFIYAKEDISKALPVTINVKDVPLKEALNRCFAHQPLTYLIKNNIIVVKPSLLQPTPQAPPNKTINGVVSDSATGSPLIGVTIKVKGTTTGTVTDANGRFSLSVPEDAVLVVSYLGYKTKEISVEGKTSFHISLAAATTGLNQLVVVGYGTQSRRSVTSSVASVEMKNVDEMPVASVSQALSGQAAGLNVHLNSAQPGGNVSFQIRGAATGRKPLIVIDGMPTSDFTPVSVGSQFGTGSLDGTLSTLNPDDIASIDILKDASATAIYGSKAAGGVILITTKRGRRNAKSGFNVNLNVSSGIQEFYRIPKMLNAVEYMKETNRVMKEEWLYDSRKGVYSGVSKPAGWTPPGPFSPYYDENKIQAFENGTQNGTDFVDKVTRVGSVQDASLSVRGNGKSTRFYTSLSYFNQKGIIKNNGLKKYIGRLNVDQDFGEKVTGGITVNFSQINSDNVAIGNGGLYEHSGILLSALQFDPTLPVRDENGDFQKNVRQSNFPNPVSLLDITNNTQIQRIFTTAYLKYDLLPNLFIKTQVGFDRSRSEGHSYLPTSTIAGMSYNGRAEVADNKNTNYQFQLLANYNKTFDVNHNLSVVLGTEFMKYNWEGYNIIGTNFPYDGVLWHNLGLGADRPIISSNGGNTETSSYFSKIDYNYDFKYFVSVNLRVDGSANFSPEDQYAFFPGVSVGWDLSRESFLASSRNWLDQLKLRAGYGETGNDSIGSAFTNWYAPGANTIWGTSVISGVRLAGLGNPDLKWEKQVDINVGVDFSLFKNRVSGSIEYFNRVISRILGSRHLNSSNPVSSIAYNLDAEKQTYGTEVTINIENVRTSDFSWNSLLTYTYYRDRWLKRDPNYVLGINESPKQYFGELWYYKSDGLVSVDSKDQLNPIPGTVKIEDVNGYLLDNSGKRVTDENGKPLYSGSPDGKINAADLVKIGINTPFTIGFTNHFKYKNFDLSINTYGMFNRWKINQTKMTLGSPGIYKIVSIGSNLMENTKDRWNSDHLNGTEPSALQALTKYGTGDFYLEKAWFVRIRYISLGYGFSNKILEKLKMNKLRIYASLMNPFLFTPYTGMDPETDNYVAAYPNQRTYSLGIELSF